MRIIDRTVERMRGEVAQVFLREFAESADHRHRRTEGVFRERIGFVFVLARNPVADRGKQNVTSPPKKPKSRKAGASAPGGRPKEALNQGAWASQATTPKPANCITAAVTSRFGIWPRL